MGKTIDIEGVEVGYGHDCFIIAEIGQAHDGSLGMAHSYIDLAKKVGANAVKFQTHICELNLVHRINFELTIFSR